MSTCFGTMQQDIGDTILRNSQGVVGTVAGSVYFGTGPEASERKALAACRAALYLTDPEIDRNNIIRAKGDRTVGTCSWIQSNPRFQSWLRGDSNLLWIRGGPGKGKTMMSVYLTEAIASEKCRSLAYYFCICQEMKQNNASAVLRGILWQITEHHPDLMQHVLPYFDRPERGSATISSEETLWKLLTEICPHAETQRLFCLVDGVDECDEDSMHWLVDKFSSVEYDPAFSNLSLIVLSRPVAGIDDSTCITLDPDHQGQVSDDVDLFIRSKVRDLSKKLRFDEAFETNAAKVLSEKSEGTFLWVGFVMAELLKKRTRSQVEKAMDSLPKVLPAVFARMLQNIQPDDRDNSKKLLICTALAFRKLSLKALADILSCQSSATISEEQVTMDEIEICAPMLNFRGQAVEFVHQSAKDYLLRDQIDHDPVLEDFRISPEKAHLYLTRRCLRSLAEGTYLQHYSLLNWPKHAERLNDFASSLFEQEVSFFEKFSLARSAWWRKYSANFAGLPQVVPPRLHMACFMGLETWARAIVHEEKRSGRSSEDVIQEKCPGGWVALDYAAAGPSDHLLKLLLDQSFTEKHSNEQLQCSLFRAVVTQRETAVRSILSCGTNANVKDDKGVPLLLHATMLQDRAIVQSLLEHRADPNISDSNAVYPVQIACQNSRGQALVIMLLNAGADPNTRNPDGHTLLNWASFQGQLHIIKILLEHGANSALLKIDSRLMNPSHAGQGMKDSPLHTAVAFGRLDVVQLLICHGADINLRDRTQETVIHVAQSRLSTYTEHAFSLQLQFITFLLQSGADLNARRHDGKTSLHLAAGSGKLVMSELFASVAPT